MELVITKQAINPNVTTNTDIISINFVLYLFT